MVPGLSEDVYEDVLVCPPYTPPCQLVLHHAQLTTVDISYKLVQQALIDFNAFHRTSGSSLPLS